MFEDLILMRFSGFEIEMFLYLYPVSKKKFAEIDELLKYSILDDSRIKELKSAKILYEKINRLVEYWFNFLSESELQLIKYRYFNKFSYDHIANLLCYQNHSSIIKHNRKIIKKIERGTYDRHN
ncbi:hypothetical protein MKA27_19675 [[Clostridium] innocuum]|nr:hypothetical protein [[Clostridium] innocuum]MCR0371923.1 hypothetical protein [[Clostridium] innocuum]MCR0376010.1 hypothetical protein [[Clostridium] innocuum]MCR0604533.1 hypothetical protein [[Clostridium] innocuum]